MPTGGINAANVASTSRSSAVGRVRRIVDGTAEWIAAKQFDRIRDESRRVRTRCAHGRQTARGRMTRVVTFGEGHASAQVAGRSSGCSSRRRSRRRSAAPRRTSRVARAVRRRARGSSRRFQRTTSWRCVLAALRSFGVDVGRQASAAERLGIYFLETGVDIQRPSRVTYDRAGSVDLDGEGADFDWDAILDERALVPHQRRDAGDERSGRPRRGRGRERGAQGRASR